jgi:hypothetical protein
MARSEPLHFSDELWVRTVYEFLLAHHRDVMKREHIERALVPLYLGRTGSFLLQYGAAEPVQVNAALESLGAEFERAKPDVVARWNEAPKR